MRPYPGRNLNDEVVHNYHLMWSKEGVRMYLAFSSRKKMKGTFNLNYKLNGTQIDKPSDQKICRCYSLFKEEQRMLHLKFERNTNPTLFLQQVRWNGKKWHLW
ncbi:hypothetical protein PR048_021597, partial [Dryococelus australis]